MESHTITLLDLPSFTQPNYFEIFHVVMYINNSFLFIAEKHWKVLYSLKTYAPKQTY